MRRLRYLGPWELAGRLVQAVHRLGEYRDQAVVDMGREVGGLLAPLHPDLVAIARGLGKGELEPAQDLLRWMRERLRPRFVALPEERALLSQVMREQCRQDYDRLLAEAAQAREHRFPILGLGLVACGPQVNWQANPDTGRSWPMRRWWQVPYLTAAAGDVRFAWELGRLRGAVALARAWWLTGEPEQAEAALALALAWLQENRPGWGVHWASSLEVAMRSLALLWTYHLCLESPGLTPAAHLRLLLGFAQAGNHLLRYPSLYSSPYNHLVGEAAGLYALGMLLPELKPARRWRSVGQGWLDRALGQLLPDGAYPELASGYHRLVLELFEFCAALALRNGRPIAAWLEGIERMSEWAAALASASGLVARLGDSDGGSAAFSPDRDESDFWHVLDVAAALLGRPDLVRGPLCSETLWLLGQEGLQTRQRLPPVRPVDTGVRLAASGLVVLRDERLALVFDCGPHAWGRAQAHAHADSLALTCTVEGWPALVERGTYTYTGHAGWREHFRGTGAHNTVAVDGCAQAEGAGPFAWGRRGRSRGLEHAANLAFELARGSYERCYRRGLPVVHERTVVLVRGSYAVVLDRVSGKGTHELAVHWHLPPGWEPRGTWGLVVDWPGAEKKLIEGGPEPGPGWHSDRYGQRVSAPTLRLVKVCALPQEALAVIWAGREARGRLLAEGRAAVSGNWGEDQVDFGPPFVFVRREAQGVTGLGLAGGRQVAVSGEVLLECDREVAHLSVGIGGLEAAVEGSPFAWLRLRAACTQATVGGVPACCRREGDYLVITGSGREGQG